MPNPAPSPTLSLSSVFVGVGSAVDMSDGDEDVEGNEDMEGEDVGDTVVQVSVAELDVERRVELQLSTSTMRKEPELNPFSSPFLSLYCSVK